MAVVSVIIPTYNGERWITQAIESVLNQEGVKSDDIEILVVDDGSRDRTLEVARKYPCKIVELGGNFGVARARNEGIKRASGKFIAFLDQDDLFLPNKISLSLSVMQEGDFDFVYSDILIYDEVLKSSYLRVYFSGNRKELLRLLFLDVIGVPTVWMIRKDAFEKIGYFDESIFGSDDWELSFRIVRKLRYAKLSAPTGIYRMHRANTHRYVERIREGQEKALLKAIREIPPEELFDDDPKEGYTQLAQMIKKLWWERHYFYPEKVLQEIERKIRELDKKER